MNTIPDLKDPSAGLPDIVLRKRLYEMERYDGVEIQPVAYDEPSDSYEVCEGDDPRLVMWSVYLHLIPVGTQGGVDCCADFATEIEAQRFAQGLCWANGWELPQ